MTITTSIKHTYPDGTYVENPVYATRGGKIVIVGGLCYDKNGTCTGHADDPGHPGTPGQVGKD